MNSQEILVVGKSVLHIAAQSILDTERMLDDSFCEAVSLLHNTKGNIIISGMGKSGIIAQKIAGTLSSTGTLSHYIHPSEAFHGDFGKIKPEDTIIMISHSGETRELFDFQHVVRELHSNNKIITITADAESTLATLSDVAIITHVLKENDNPEYEHMPTTSTTVTLAITDALAIALLNLKGFKNEHFLKFHPGGNIGKLSKREKI